MQRALLKICYLMTIQTHKSCLNRHWHLVVGPILFKSLLSSYCISHFLVWFYFLWFYFNIIYTDIKVLPIQFLKVHDLIILIIFTVVQALSQTILEHFASSKEDPQALFPSTRAVENYAIFCSTLNCLCFQCIFTLCVLLLNHIPLYECLTLNSSIQKSMDFWVIFNFTLPHSYNLRLFDIYSPDFDSSSFIRLILISWCTTSFLTRSRSWFNRQHYFTGCDDCSILTYYHVIFP